MIMKIFINVPVIVIHLVGTLHNIYAEVGVRTLTPHLLILKKCEFLSDRLLD